jgi:hypothetical protein
LKSPTSLANQNQRFLPVMDENSPKTCSNISLLETIVSLLKTYASLLSTYVGRSKYLFAARNLRWLLET